MSARFQRLLIITLSLVFLSISIFLILSNSKKNLVFFFTPSEFLQAKTKINDVVRIGGFVQKGSIKNNGDNNYKYIITDNKEIVYVSFNGLLPDLFREEQGAVIEGTVIKNKYIRASTVFAKHDENYMPSQIEQQLKNNEYWKKNYK